MKLLEHAIPFIMLCVGVFFLFIGLIAQTTEHTLFSRDNLDSNNFLRLGIVFTGVSAFSWSIVYVVRRLF
ncbi:MAG: hypothetical protein GF334_12075 [Candidatus Altiarchaeales archaeon]|nr:hypothetical protein [Candidatus Altiarchaeales archaeon]